LTGAEAGWTVLPPGLTILAMARFRGFGFLAAIIALAGQLAFGATLPQPVLARIAFGQLCHAGAAGRAPAHPDRRAPLSAASPLCTALAMPTPPLAVVPPVPVPPAPIHFVRLAPRPVNAAPPAAPRAASPRGPPLLV
jgi:hypothetical protein